MNTTILRHPDAATVMSFAAGGLPEPLAAVVSAHLVMCAQCRDELRDMECMGAALLGTAAEPGGQDAAVAVPVMPRELESVNVNPPHRGAWVNELPAPIAHRYRLTFDRIAWKPLGPGAWHSPLPLSPGVDGYLGFIKLAPGSCLPAHGHGGAELTLVLTGAFADITGEYRRGDVQDIDCDTRHQVLGDPQLGCVCIVASEAVPVLQHGNSGGSKKRLPPEGIGS